MGHILYLRKGTNHSFNGLPSGYTRLEYIEATGSQYLDTGFKPNQDTRVVMDCNIIGGSNYPTPFGTWNSSSDSQFICLSYSATETYHYYHSAVNKISLSILGNHLLDLNKNQLYVDGTLVGTNTNTGVTFQCNYPLYLCTLNDINTPRDINMAHMCIYSCKIYDNNTLVRNFVPCTNSSGTVGMYDTVGKTFYSSASSTAFTAGSVA